MTLASDGAALAATTRDTWTTAHTNAALSMYAKRLAFATAKYREKLATYAAAVAAGEPAKRAHDPLVLAWQAQALGDMLLADLAAAEARLGRSA